MNYKMLIFFLFPFYLSAQSDVGNYIRGAELLLGGLSFLKVAKSDVKVESKFIESICIKNKFDQKIVFRIFGISDENDSVKKELVIQMDGKECVFNLPKGIYTYELEYPQKEIYKKGEYKFEQDLNISLKKDN